MASRTKMCFEDAFWASQRNQITRVEYVLSAVAHFAGVRHSITDQGDNSVSICPGILYDGFARAVRKLTVESDRGPCKSAEYPIQ